MRTNIDANVLTLILPIVFQCKLDKPVYVDDSEVELQLNRNNNFPTVDSKVTAIGLGTTSSGGTQATFLQEVEVDVNSNEDCASASNPSIVSDSFTRLFYNTDSISEENICACTYCIVLYCEMSV